MENRRQGVFKSYTELLQATTEEGNCGLCSMELSLLDETAIEKHMESHWKTRIEIEGRFDLYNCYYHNTHVHTCRMVQHKMSFNMQRKSPLSLPLLPGYTPT